MIDHYVLGIDDDYIAEGQYQTLKEAQDAADIAWETTRVVSPHRVPWKIDIEARDAWGRTVSVETWYEDDEPYDL